MCGSFGTFGLVLHMLHVYLLPRLTLFIIFLRLFVERTGRVCHPATLCQWRSVLPCFDTRGRQQLLLRLRGWLGGTSVHGGRFVTYI